MKNMSMKKISSQKLHPSCAIGACMHDRTVLLCLLRRIVPRIASLVLEIPHGRGVLFLAKADSAAKVLSRGLYEYRQLAIRFCRSRRSGLSTYPRHVRRGADARRPRAAAAGCHIDDLLTLGESLAALKHLLCTAEARPKC